MLNRSATTVTDFTPVKDLLFARDTLADEDLRLFEAIYGRLNDGSGPADLVVYLRGSPELALQRVRRRSSASTDATSTMSTVASRKRWSSTALSG